VDREVHDAHRVTACQVGRFYPHDAGPGIGLRFSGETPEAEVVFVLDDALALSLASNVLWQLGVDPRLLPRDRHQESDDTESEGT
jgi:hypothetical protein